jgi:hypothetical protein
LSFAANRTTRSFPDNRFSAQQHLSLCKKRALVPESRRKELVLSKCANPRCSTPFHYFREGRIVILRENTLPYTLQKPREERRRPSHNVEHFWLCGPCSSQYEITLNREGAISVIPLKTVVNGKPRASHEPEPARSPVLHQKAAAA